MVRYLVRFSYKGTHFSGSQRQAPHGFETKRIATVQDVMEKALDGLPLRRIPVVNMAGRTDAGVHALSAAANFDLDHTDPRRYFIPSAIMHRMNKFFKDYHQAIRVNDIRIVPEDFNCRHKAKSRTYVYRVAVIGAERDDKFSMYKEPGHIYLCPFMEDELSYRVCQPFDVDKFIAGARLFRGTYDFTSFTKPDKPNSRTGLVKPPRNPVRNMETCEVTRGSGIFAAHDPWQKNIEYFDVVLKSSGFLYKQVRKIVGSLVALAKGRVTETDIEYMLQNPSATSWNPKIKTAPPEGLFFKDVEYDEKDLELPSDYFDVIQRFGCSYRYKSGFESLKLVSLIDGRIAQLENSLKEPGSSDSIPE